MARSTFYIHMYYIFLCLWHQLTPISIYIRVQYVDLFNVAFEKKNKTYIYIKLTHVAQDLVTKAKRSFKKMIGVCYREHLKRNDTSVLKRTAKQNSNAFVSTSNHMQAVNVCFRGSFLSWAWRMWRGVERGSTAHTSCCCLKYEKNEGNRTTEGNTATRQIRNLPFCELKLIVGAFENIFILF